MNKLWGECHFVLDANTLLNLLRYPKETSNAMLKLLESIQERIWIPHQVALEYHKNLETVIYEQKNEYETLEKECMSELQKLISKLKKLRHSNISTNTMVQTLEKSSEIIKKELANQREKQPDLQEIIIRIKNLVGENIGLAFDQAELDKIFTEGALRYENKVPPGYMDGKKNYSYFHNGVKYQAAYGDLVFWKQILRYAQTKEVNSIILVSDDRKEDWIFEVSGEKKGIHPYLINEFNNQTEGKLFNSYNSVQFISHAEKVLGFKSSASVSDVIKEIETVYNKEDSTLINDYFVYNHDEGKLYDKFQAMVQKKYFDSVEDVTAKAKESEHHFYKIFFDISDNFIKMEKENVNKSVYADKPAFHIVMDKILNDVHVHAQIAEIEYEGEFLTLVFSMPYSFNALAELGKAINRELKLYYSQNDIKLLRIFNK